MSTQTEVDQKAKREHEMSLQRSLIESGKFPTCVSCSQFKHEEQICGRFNARPPIAWIVTGCAEYDKDIPF